jgi:hypothetical protein
VVWWFIGGGAGRAGLTDQFIALSRLSEDKPPAPCALQMFVARRQLQ